MSRLHYLDHLRAHMMLLGIVFHCALSYTHIEPDRNWAYVEPASHYLLDMLCGALHRFRMPAFFIVAGFFSVLIMQRWSVRHFLRDRTLRILLPLLLFALPNEWLTRTIYALSQPEASAAAEFEWHHLWFLYFLLLFYGLHLLLRLAVRLPGGLLPAQWLTVPVTRLALPFGAVMGLAIYSNGVLHDIAPIALVPDRGQFLLYLACYALGAALYRHPGLSGREPALFAVGTVAKWWLLWSLLYLAAANLVLFPGQIGSNGFNPVSALCLGMAKLYSALLVIALYQRFLQRESAAARYLSNSSYWLYLMHFPLAIALPPLLQDWAVAPTLKFGLVLGVTMLAGLLSYEWLVRDTALGQLLNGKRQPRRTPAIPAIHQA